MTWCKQAFCQGDGSLSFTITAGPMARAASVEGAIDPTARPSADDVKLSRVKMPRNLANLHPDVHQSELY